MAALCLALAGLWTAAAEADTQPEELTVPLHLRPTWVRLPRTAAEVPAEGVPAITHSALRILRAFDPATGEFYAEPRDMVGCDPKSCGRATPPSRSSFRRRPRTASAPSITFGPR